MEFVISLCMAVAVGTLVGIRYSIIRLCLSVEAIGDKLDMLNLKEAYDETENT
mgnify:FL=1